jgi:hypothetical protein
VIDRGQRALVDGTDEGRINGYRGHDARIGMVGIIARGINLGEIDARLHHPCAINGSGVCRAMIDKGGLGQAHPAQPKGRIAAQRKADDADPRHVRLQSQWWRGGQQIKGCMHITDAFPDQRRLERIAVTRRRARMIGGHHDHPLMREIPRQPAQPFCIAPRPMRQQHDGQGSGQGWGIRANMAAIEQPVLANQGGGCVTRRRIPDMQTHRRCTPRNRQLCHGIAWRIKLRRAFGGIKEGRGHHQGDNQQDHDAKSL